MPTMSLHLQNKYTLISSQLLCMDMNMGTNIKSDESHQLR